MSSQRTYTEEEKMKYVAEFKASGMSMNEYAKEVDIPEATFRDWLKIDRELGFGRINVNKPLTPITPITTTNKKPMVFVNDDIRIELKEGFNKQFLRQIIEVLCNAN